MSAKDNSSVEIFSASWVVPVAGPAIMDGAVAVKEGRIMAVGPASQIRFNYPGCEENTGRGVLMPALINAHCHLELSHLKTIARPITQGQICAWIDALIKKRSETAVSAEEKLWHRQNVLSEQRRLGVVLIGDIGNDPYQPVSNGNMLPLIRHFREFLAPTQEAMEAAKVCISELPDSCSATAHACYSTLPEVITAIKERARRLDRIFSIHVAESAEEREFITSHTGAFRDFLEARGAWHNAFSSVKSAEKGVVEYLHDLGVLDDLTLCVHCVHITEDEARLLFKKGSHVCLCPGSNRFLKVGRAPLEMMLRCGLLPAIGTDSAASNERLDIWAEMQILREEHPAVDVRAILGMATIGGASALNSEQDFGSLAPGKKSVFLRVDSEEIRKAESQSMLYDILTRNGCPAVVEWIAHSEM